MQIALVVLGFLISLIGLISSILGIINYLEYNAAEAALGLILQEIAEDHIRNNEYNKAVAMYQGALKAYLKAHEKTKTRQIRQIITMLKRAQEGLQ